VLITTSMLYKECYDNGIVFDKTDVLLEEFEYEGAIVSNPSPGLYRWCSLLDFSSLYPSMIISHNICYSTFIIAMCIAVLYAYLKVALNISCYPAQCTNYERLLLVSPSWQFSSLHASTRYLPKCEHT